MLSVASLSVFSGMIGPVQPSPLPSPGGAMPGTATPAPAAPEAPPTGAAGNSVPIRLLPRGSLLDISA